MRYLKLLIWIGCGWALAFGFVDLAMADTTTLDIGGVANQVKKSFGPLAKVITAVSYIAGMGFAVSAVLKFKAHKDSPQQTAIGQPIGLFLVAVFLLYMPTLFGVSGMTFFSSTGGVGGISGISSF